MANTSTVYIGATASGAEGTITLPTVTISNAASPLSQLALTLSAGFTSVPIPSGTSFITVQTDAANTQTLTIKGITGDTGIPVLAAGGIVGWTPTSGATTFGLTAGANFSTITRVTFW